jgi:hypothetical protein
MHPCHGFSTAADDTHRVLDSAEELSLEDRRNPLLCVACHESPGLVESFAKMRQLLDPTEQVAPMLEHAAIAIAATKAIQATPAHDESDNLTLDEAAAIHLYTQATGFFHFIDSILVRCNKQTTNNKYGFPSNH